VHAREKQQQLQLPSTDTQGAHLHASTKMHTYASADLVEECGEHEVVAGGGQASHVQAAHGAGHLIQLPDLQEGGQGGRGGSRRGVRERDDCVLRSNETALALPLQPSTIGPLIAQACPHPCRCMCTQHTKKRGQHPPTHPPGSGRPCWAWRRPRGRAGLAAAACEPSCLACLAYSLPCWACWAGPPGLQQRAEEGR
jgi:hypothetical protein